MGKWGKRIGYGIGDLGCNLVFSTMASYLMVFYTDVFWDFGSSGGHDDARYKIYRCIYRHRYGLDRGPDSYKMGTGKAVLSVRGSALCNIYIYDLSDPGLREQRKIDLGLCDLLSALYCVHGGQYPAEYYRAEADFGYP